MLPLLSLIMYEAKSFLLGSPASVNVNTIVAPSTPLRVPVPVPVKVLKLALGGFGPPISGSLVHTAVVRLVRWKLLPLSHSTSSLFGSVVAGSQ